MAKLYCLSITLLKECIKSEYRWTNEKRSRAGRASGLPALALF